MILTATFIYINIMGAGSNPAVPTIKFLDRWTNG